jgi:tetratricopeptide (TPR) repeat protein/class 3 adenylate cyclase
MTFPATNTPFFCPRCREQLPDKAKFCSSCGAPTPIKAIVADKDPVAEQGERRIATVLFSDLSGYTALNQHLDPEDVEAVMLRLKQMAIEIVETYGGIVNQFVGDEVLALFGVDAAHEDDPVRAVRSAFDLHAAARHLSAEVDSSIGESLAMHTGIHTGLIVTNAHDSRDGIYGITGDTVITAVRLKAASPRDVILVSEVTYKLIAPYFHADFWGNVDVKGRAAPVTCYSVTAELAIHSRFEASQKRGLTQYTARARELDQLTQAFERTRTGTDQFVVVVGEAGIGKSRLLYEFTREIRPTDVVVLQGSCQTDAISTSYHPFLDVLRRELGIVADQSSHTVVDTAGATLTAIHPTLQEYLPIYLHLLSLRTDPILSHMQATELKHLIREALVQLFLRKADRKPTLLLLEDWHWSDEASNAVLQHLLTEMRGRALMVGLTHRSEYVVVGWGQRSPDIILMLPPLDIAQTERLLAATLAVRELPAGLADLLYERTGGNPLFIEEASHSLVEEGIVVKQGEEAVLTRSFAASHLPATVQGLIQSRLDRLHPDWKEVLGIASVIGRSFTLSLLEPLYKGRICLQDVLESLVAIDMISPLEEATYLFKHVLTQQVTYETLLLKRRRMLHRSVAQTIERVFEGRLTEHVQTLYHHVRLAEEWEKMVTYGQSVADKAQRLSQFQEAVVVLDEVTDALRRLPLSRSRQHSLVDILLVQERLYDTLGARERQEAVIGEMFSILVQEEDVSRLAAVQLRQGDLLTQQGKYLDAEDALESSLELRREIADEAGESNALRSLSFLRWHQGRSREALACNERALAIDQKLGDGKSIVHNLTNLAAVLQSLDDMEGALAKLTEALTVEAAGDPFHRMTIFYNIGNIHSKLSQYDEALKYYEEALRPCVDHRLYINQTLVLGCIASMYQKQERLEESLHYYQQVVDISKRITYPQGCVNGLRGLVDILLLRNQANEALPYLLESIAILGDLGDMANEAISWQIAASIYERCKDRWNEAVKAWDQVRKLAQRLNDLPRQLNAVEGMARNIRLGGGNNAGALSHLQEAYRLATKLKQREDVGRFLNSMAIIEWERQNYTSALGHYEEALAVYRDLGDDRKVGFILNSIAVTLRSMSRFDEAITALDRALAIHRETNERLHEGQALAVMGHLHADRDQFTEAIDAYQRSLTIRREIGDPVGQGWMTYYIALIYVRQKQVQEGRSFVSQAHEIASTYEDQELRQACLNLTRIIHEASAANADTRL